MSVICLVFFFLLSTSTAELLIFGLTLCWVMQIDKRHINLGCFQPLFTIFHAAVDSLMVSAGWLKWGAERGPLLVVVLFVQLLLEVAFFVTFVCLWLAVCLCIWFVCLCVCVRVHACAHTCMHLWCVCMCVHAHMHACIYGVCESVCACVRTCVHAFMVCVGVCIYVWHECLCVCRLSISMRAKTCVILSVLKPGLQISFTEILFISLLRYCNNRVWIPLSSSSW